MEKYREGVRRLALSAGFVGLFIRLMNLGWYFFLEGGNPESIRQWIVILSVTVFYFIAPYLLIKYGYEWAIWIKKGFVEE